MRNYRIDFENGYWYDNKPDFYGLKHETINAIEQQYKCKFVAEWNLLDSQNNPHEHPVLLFWNDVPHPTGSNWMGMYRHQNEWYVCDGITASRFPINCMVSNDKQVLFSKSRHDFRSSNDSSVSVDGGRDYTRVLGAIHNERVWLVPQNGELKIIPSTMAILMTERNK